MFGQNNVAMDWDSVLESDGSEFTVLPECDATFEVISMERGTFPGSEKMCASPKATLTLKITDPEHGTINILDDLILHKKMEWKLSSFFRAIGLKQKGERLAMNWSKVVGSKGKAHIIASKYKTKDGQEREVNRIAKYYDYDASGLPKQDEFIKVPDELSEELPFV